MFSVVPNPIKCDFCNIDSSAVINKISRKKRFKIVPSRINIYRNWTELLKKKKRKKKELT